MVAGVTATGSPAQAAGSSVISGTVFQDLNRNGTQDAGEAGFANAFLALSDGSGNTLTTAYTDQNGHFQFGGLANGNYGVGFAGGWWSSFENDWVMTSQPSPAPGYLNPRVPVSLSGTATANIALRPVVRSATPVSTLTTPSGTVINSFDDAVPATDVASALAQGSLFGAEQPHTTIDFDYGPSQTSTQVSGAPGSYSNYRATVDIRYTDWVDKFDWPLFYEYGHAWSMYYMYIVQQDPGLSAYLAARGLSGNPNVGTSQLWAPLELIADDYRELFGSANARSYPQDNTQIPPASQVPGLGSFLQSTFTQPALSTASFLQPPPSVAAIGPNNGPAAGGTSVTIDGSNFTGSGWGVSGVTFGPIPASGYTVASPSQIVAVAPPGSAVVDVSVRTVATVDGYLETSPTTSADQFTYVPTPTISGISPARGPMKGGTSVTITGTGFSGPGFAAAVYFGNVAAAFTVVSPTMIVATSPSSRTLQSVMVTVATPGGTSASGTSSTFTYTRK